MGTNYYRVNIPTKEQIQEMHRLIDEGKFESRRGWWVGEENRLIGDDEITCVQDLINTATESVHICKCSYGWKTSFDHNWGKYYQPGRKTLEEFLKQPNTVIKDEYGEVISYEDFWKMVDERDSCIYPNGMKPLIFKTYQELLRKEGKQPDYICREDINRCRETFGVHTDNNDFEVEGLLFCVFSDFS